MLTRFQSIAVEREARSVIEAKLALRRRIASSSVSVRSWSKAGTDRGRFSRVRARRGEKRNGRQMASEQESADRSGSRLDGELRRALLGGEVIDQLITQADGDGVALTRKDGLVPDELIRAGP